MDSGAMQTAPDRPATPPTPVPAAADPAGPEPATAAPEPTGFHVTLTNFEGPFDLLLSLISKHKLDVTEVALSQVTDEFIHFIESEGDQLDLDQATEFLVVAATLLDLKAARLLPSAEVEDEEDLAALEARDLLFARLLAYRAFKEAAQFLRAHELDQARRFSREVALEPRFAQALPEVLLGVGAEAFAALAASALTPRQAPEVSLTHLHAARVSVREHASILRRRLIAARTLTFRSLTSDCSSTLEVVARFLALLDFHVRGRVSFEQLTALGELHVHWSGDDDSGDDDDDDADQADGTAVGSEFDEDLGPATGRDSAQPADPAAEG